MWYVENRYKYAICINLTTTCWDYRNFSQADAVDRQEIIGRFCFLLFLFFGVVVAIIIHVLGVWSYLSQGFFDTQRYNWIQLKFKKKRQQQQQLRRRRRQE